MVLRENEYLIQTNNYIDELDQPVITLMGQRLKPTCPSIFYQFIGDWKFIGSSQTAIVVNDELANKLPSAYQSMVIDFKGERNQQLESKLEQASHAISPTYGSIF